MSDFADERPILRLAMWSGPRNISTAMMRAWGNRPDTFVCDEPLYAYYLNATRLPHPMADEIIRTGQIDWKRAVAELTTLTPTGKTIYYQKHMTHHLLPEVDRGWLAQVASCFLIRDPAQVIASYAAKNNDPTLEDVGFVQQAEIFELVCRMNGRTPCVLDAQDVLENPRRQLGLLCDAFNVPFSESMLSWPPGLRPTDGIWAAHWYTEVETSTGFRPYRAKTATIPDRLRNIYERCLEVYERLRVHRLI
jgi:Sulfotransferase domain